MTEDSKPEKNLPDADHPAGEGPAEESRRKEARRRFLSRGTAAASGGLVVYSFHHTRAFAGAKKLLVSSPEACASLGGQTGKQKKAVDSLNPIPIISPKSGKIKGYVKNVTKYECAIK